MEAETEVTLRLSFDQEEAKQFIEIWHVIAKKPNAVGFGKKDFTDEQKEFIRGVWSMFEDEQHGSDI